MGDQNLLHTSQLTLFRNFKFVYINGSNHNQLEIVDFLDHEGEATGFGPLYTRALRGKIQHIRATVHYV